MMILLVSIFGSSLSSCSGGAGAGLGTSSAGCYTALPTSFNSAGTKAHLLGVKLLSATQVSRFAKRFKSHGVTKVCLFAFQLPNKDGSYVRTRSKGKVIGHFVLVFYAIDRNEILRRQQVFSLPIDFAHAFSILS